MNPNVTHNEQANSSLHYVLTDKGTLHRQQWHHWTTVSCEPEHAPFQVTYYLLASICHSQSLYQRRSA